MPLLYMPGWRLWWEVIVSDMFRPVMLEVATVSPNMSIPMLRGSI